jgi:hypothetical protein
MNAKNVKRNAKDLPQIPTSSLSRLASLLFGFISAKAFAASIAERSKTLADMGLDIAPEDLVLRDDAEK